MNRLTIFALALSGTSASFLAKRQFANFDVEAADHLEKVCRPQNSTGQYDPTFPCNALLVTQYQCMYGPYGGDLVLKPHGEDDDYGHDDEDPQPLSNATQRACICQSQHNDLMAGCMDCVKAHGGTEGDDYVAPKVFDPIMSKYCDANETPTQGYGDVVFAAAPTSFFDTRTKSFEDPLGNATAVSLYTPAATGSTLYLPSAPTPESSGAEASYTSVYTSGGQIMPTAGLEQQKAAASSGSSTESAGSGAMATALANPGAAAGMLGLAALVAAL